MTFFGSVFCAGGMCSVFVCADTHLPHDVQAPQ